MHILAIDPSINNVGLASCKTDETELTRPRMITALCNPLEISRKNSLRLQSIGNDIVRYLHLWCGKPTHLIIEYPQWEASTRGVIAAQQGYTLDIAYLVGHIVGWSDINPRNILLPTPMQWKGNQPKKATEAIVQAKFGMLQISEHEYDACGLLLWGAQEFKVSL